MRYEVAGPGFLNLVLSDGWHRACVRSVLEAGETFAAGGAAYGPALTDVVVMAPDSRVFVTGPDVVRSVTGEDVDMASLGGPDTHHKKSGVCHIVADDERDAYERGRRLVGLFCQQGHFDRSKAEAHDSDSAPAIPPLLRAAMPGSSRAVPQVPFTSLTTNT